MAYTKTNWVNDSTPAINAENLNKIEQGIYDNDTGKIPKITSPVSGNIPTVNSDGTLSDSGVAIGSIPSANSVRYDVSQSLSDAQKQTARTNINAAPGGYGLGTYGKVLGASDNLNNITSCGWYYWTTAPQNGVSGTCIMLVSALNGSNVAQEVYQFSNPSYKSVRVCSSGSWGGWYTTNTVEYAKHAYWGTNDAHLRDTGLVTTDTVPTGAGNINWTYG